MSVTALGYIGVGVSDLKAWETFATSILGLQIGSRGEDGTLNLRMDERHRRIALHPGGNDDLAYLGWEVADEKALLGIGQALKAAGIAYATADPAACRERGVGGMLVCDDPAGIRTEISYGAFLQRQLAFISPRGVAGFRTGDQGLGHVVLSVPDASAAMAFYRDALGFRVSDFIEWTLPNRGPVSAAFMHCNPRHHSLAFMQAPRSPKRLQHFMLEVNLLDDVGRTYSLCEREDVPIAQTLGKHTNDEMLSFYVASPSGFLVEYGYGGRTVDDENWQVQTYDSTSIWGHRRLIAPAPLPPEPQSAAR